MKITQQVFYNAKINYRQQFLKKAACTVTALGGFPLTRLATAHSTVDDNERTTLDLHVAGYPVNHVQALVDGRVQVQGCRTVFEPGKIGDLNTLAFEGNQKYEITEIGLSPFMLAYASQGVSRLLTYSCTSSAPVSAQECIRNTLKVA